MEAADDARDEAKAAARESRSNLNGTGEAPTSAEIETGNGGSPLGEQVVRPMWDSFQAEMMDKLNAITIDDLCREAETKDIKPASQAGMDFTI